MEMLRSLRAKKLVLIAFVWLTFGQVAIAMGQKTCAQVYTDQNKKAYIVSGAQFLHQKNSALHMSDPVEHRANQIRLQGGKTLSKPADKLLAWLEYLEQSYKRHGGSSEVLERIKKFYHEKYVTKLSGVPESFFDLQIRAAREQGHGTLTMTPEMRNKSALIAISDQKNSLDKWLNYFLSKDSESYPMWAKYWAFTSMVKLGKFNAESGSFGSRAKGQMSPFPELNREAFAMVVDLIVQKLNGRSLEDIKDPILIGLVKDASFAKLYGRALQLANTKIEMSSVEGEWVIYKQGSDPKPLVDSLEGMNTGWCTAGTNTAREQLKDGDFHVFYSKDEHGNAKIPRIAIRMDGESIGEVRGIAKDQNLDAKIASSAILDTKLKEFGSEGEAYIRSSSDMKRLSQIENKHKAGVVLSKDELRFLYETEGRIFGFGYEKDPRIEEIKSQRNLRQDLVQIYSLKIKPSEISLTAEEALRGGFKLHYGDLNFYRVEIPSGTVFPEMVMGDMDFHGYSSLKGVVLPKIITDSLRLDIQSAEGLVLPNSVGGNIDFYNPVSAKGLILPESVGGRLAINGLTSFEDLVFPKSIRGSLELNKLKTAKGLKLPESIEGHFSFNSLESAEGVVFPKRIGKSMTLDGLRITEGLVLPKSVGQNLSLWHLQSAKGLNLPEFIGGKVFLRNIRSLDGMNLPEGLKNRVSLKDSP